MDWHELVDGAFNVRERCRAALRGRTERHALVLSSHGNAHGLMFPLHFYRDALAGELGLSFREELSDRLDEKLAALRAFRGELVVLSVPLRQDGAITSRAAVRQFVRAARAATAARLVFFDPGDSTISPYFDVLPDVDSFWMPFTFRDRWLYARHFAGGNVYADFLHRHGLAATSANEYHDELFGSSPASDQVHKIRTAWNWAFWRRLVTLSGAAPGGARDLDVVCRVWPYCGWCREHRSRCIELLRTLAHRHVVEATSEKVPRAAYYRELAHARISFSPFGWGEICPKDFESILYGAVLMKPSVAHVATFPDVLAEGETYVPVHWDLSDLADRVTRLLDHPQDAALIAQNAAERYRAAVSAASFVGHLRDLLAPLELDG